MKTILCYGDSNTWGSIPGSGERFAKYERWPGVLQNELGVEYEIIEEGLSGRTTVWDDPIEGVMSGKDYLKPCLRSHRPVDLVILMLGTNDLKPRFAVSAFDVAESIGSLITVLQESKAGPFGSSPQVLVLVPPPLGKPADCAEFFHHAVEKSRKLAEQCERVAKFLGCSFLDTSQIVVSSDIDGVHLELSEHCKLGQAVARIVRDIFPAYEAAWSKAIQFG